MTNTNEKQNQKQNDGLKNIEYENENGKWALF